MSSSVAQQRMATDAQFFDSMLGLVPQSYYQTVENDSLNSKFTHSKSATVAPRQSLKESSKSGIKAKAKFDPKNYTSVLANGKSNAADSDEDMDEDDDEDDDSDEEDAEEDDEDDDDMSDEAPRKSSKQPSNSASKPSASAPSSSSSSSAAAAPSTTAPPSSLTVPSLSQLSADVGMDQLRQRLHERITGLSNKRKPEDHPFKKKKEKKDKKEKREKNDQKPSSHKTVPQKKVHPRDEFEGSAANANKKQKTSDNNNTSKPSSSTKSSSSASPALNPAAAHRVKESDLLDTNEFEFGSIKPLANPSAKTGSFSLQGKEKRKKNKSDETLLREAESFDARVAELKASGQTEQAEALQSERSMKNALLRASGVKVRDDTKSLKKAVKRDEKKKEKSRAEWAERTAAAKSVQDKFHADKIASYNKKQTGDRTRAGGGDENGEGGNNASSSSSSGPSKKAGKPGFESKKKKFLN